MQRVAWRKVEWRGQEANEEAGAVVQVKDDDGTVDWSGGGGQSDLDRLQSCLEGNVQGNW